MVQIKRDDYSVKYCFISDFVCFTDFEAFVLCIKEGRSNINLIDFILSSRGRSQYIINKFHQVSAKSKSHDIVLTLEQKAAKRIAKI